MCEYSVAKFCLHSCVKFFSAPLLKTTGSCRNLIPSKFHFQNYILRHFIYYSYFFVAIIYLAIHLNNFREYYCYLNY